MKSPENNFEAENTNPENTHEGTVIHIKEGDSITIQAEKPEDRNAAIAETADQFMKAHQGSQAEVFDKSELKGEEPSDLTNTLNAIKYDRSQKMEKYEPTVHKAYPDSSKTKRFLAKAGMFLGGLFGVSHAVKAETSAETIFTGDTGQVEQKVATKDSTKKIETVERNESVAGITLETVTSIPMSDTTNEYYFLQFNGNTSDEHKVGKMLQAISAAGFEPGSPADLKMVNKEYGAKIKGVASLIDAYTGVDDTKNKIINGKTDGPETKNLTVIDGLGNINNFEVDANIEYGYYPVLVKKKKIQQIGTDFSNRSDTVKL